MERLRRLFFHREPDEYFSQPDTAVFYLYVRFNDGIPDPDLHDPGFL